MVTLEQVKLLETKVTRTIDYVKKVTEENFSLKEKLDSCQKRIDELEVLVQRFKEEQSRIEDGILSALDRLNQFEDAVENALSGGGPAPEKKPQGAKPAAEPAEPVSVDPVEPEEESTDESVDGGELDIF
jgi:FtsZ-binding cell division protein ZapB